MFPHGLGETEPVEGGPSGATHRQSHVQDLGFERQQRSRLAWRHVRTLGRYLLVVNPSENVVAGTDAALNHALGHSCQDSRTFEKVVIRVGRGRGIALDGPPMSSGKEDVIDLRIA